jgi:hypothetical protein
MLDTVLTTSSSTSRAVGHTISVSTIDRVLDPVAIGRAVCGIFAVGVSQDVDIHQEHRSMLSRSD